MIDLTIVAIYLVGILAVGILAGRRIKNMEDFSVSDRMYTVPVLVAALAATTIGGGSTIGVAEKVYSTGLVFVLIFCISQPLYKFVLAYWITPKLSRFKGMISVGDIMGHFYGKPGQVVTGLSASFKAIGSVGAQVMALGYLFNFLMGVPYFWGVLIGGGIVVIYSGFGGIKAVTITDVFQFAVLIVAIPIICMVGLDAVGGYQGLLSTVPDDRLSIFPPNEPKIKYIMLFIIFGLPYLDSVYIQRVLMAKSAQAAANAIKINALISAPFFFLIGAIGFIALALNPEINGHTALPYLIKTILPVGFKGLAISGMLAVIMSTADSYLNNASISFVHDVVMPLKKKPVSSSTELKMARLATLVIGVLTMLAALMFTNVLDLVLSAKYFWAPVVTAPLYAGIFKLRGNARSFLVSGSIGVGIAVFWNVVLGSVMGVDGLIPGLLANAVSTILFHFYFKQKSYRPKYLNALDEDQARVILGKEGSWTGRFKWKNIRTPQIGSFLKDRVDAYGMQYMAFGVFSVVNYIFPYFMWASSSFYQEVEVSMRIMAGVISFMLIMKDFWPKTAQKYFSYYWLGSLCFCLPFYTSYMAFAHEASTFWLINMALASFLLSVLVDWICFLLLLPLGVLSAWVFYGYLSGTFILPVGISENLSLIVYLYVFSSLVGLIFSRNRSREIDTRQNIMKAVGRNVAHELRTPLTALSFGCSGVKDCSVKLEHEYLRENPKDIREFMHNLNLIREVTARNEQISVNALGLIDIMLQNLRGPQKPRELQQCNVGDCIKQALATYPFKEGERDLVKLEVEVDFSFMGDEQLFIHVLYNLLKNALYFIRSQDQGVITISSVESETHNVILFKDTGPGVPEKLQSHIFKPFYSANNIAGSGVGLAYCKEVMRSFGGDIKYISNDHKGATFALYFLK